MKPNGSIVWFAAMMMLALVPTTSVRAATEGAEREYALKAAFLYNFVQFVEWPTDAFTDANSPIVIATVGGDPFHGALEKVMQNKTVGGRSLLVKHFEGPEDIKDCHVLFIAASSTTDILAVVKKLGSGGGILLVGERERFLPGGGMIRFFEEDKKLRFQINPRAAERARLRISSKLLKLAKIYSEE